MERIKEAMRGENRGEKQARAQWSQLWVCLLPLFASFLVLVYIRSASCDVVYSDYIRLVRSYLPDVLNPKKFFVADILTRIPFTYLARWVNVTFFGYSIHFDRVLGVVGLFFMGLVLMQYVRRERLSFVWALALTFLAFGLNKWEMLLNGSGYAHFLAFGAFFWHYLILERVYTGTQKRHDHALLLVLPWLVTIVLAGPYCAVYTASVVLAYLFMWASGNRNVERRRYPQYLLSAVLPLLLYMLSNHFAVYEHAGAKDIGLLEAVTTEFWFFPKFLLNGLASTVLGGEELAALAAAPETAFGTAHIYVLGALVAVLYVGAFVLGIRFGIWKRTLFPFLLLVASMGNHAIVMLGRYIFLDPTYAWASRYALQYQEGVLGIVLIGALLLRAEHSRKTAERPVWKGILYTMVILSSLLFVGGNCYTNWQEIRKAPYREENYEAMAQAALHWRELDDEALAKRFEYKNGADRIRESFQILEDNHLNVFR